MRKQNLRQGFLPFNRVKGGEVNASIGEGLVSWCKDSERAFAFQRFKEFGLDDGGNQ